MASRRVSLALPLALCGLAACGPPSADTLGDQPEDTPKEDVELRTYCPEVDAGPLTVISESPSAVQVGPCGHTVFAATDGGSEQLYSPGTGLEDIDARIWSARFAPTGNLAAWAHEDVDGMILADLRSGERRELPYASNFGFVPVPGSEHGSDLWTCQSGTLSLAGPLRTAVLAEGVDCGSVVGSGGSPRLVFADDDGRVRFADLEAQQVWATDDDEFIDDNYDDEGRDRDDLLWIDHDGVVLVHSLIYWESDPEADADWEVGLATRVLVGVETAERFDGWHSPVQASVRGAAVIIRDQGQLMTFSGGDRHSHPGLFHSLTTDSSGRALMLDDEDGALMRLSKDGAAIETLMGVDARALSAAANGEWATVEIPVEDCLVNDQGDCVWTLNQLDRWTAHSSEDAGGIAAPTGHLEILAVTDAGVTVALGQEFEPGPVPEPLLPDSLLIYASDLTLRAERALKGYAFVRAAVALDDGRVVLELHDDGISELLIADPDAGSIEAVPGSFDVGHDEVWVSENQRVLVFADRDPEGTHRLVAGQLP